MFGRIGYEIAERNEGALKLVLVKTIVGCAAITVVTKIKKSLNL
jgi:hypothetical protein